MLAEPEHEQTDPKRLWRSVNPPKVGLWCPVSVHVRPSLRSTRNGQSFVTTAGVGQARIVRFQGACFFEDRVFSRLPDSEKRGLAWPAVSTKE
jgi:hypothetical protein